MTLGGQGVFGELAGAYSVGHSDSSVLSTDKYNKLEEWMNNNKLVISPDKTHLMILDTSAHLRQQVSMIAGEFCIRTTETENLLGGQVHLTGEGKWNQHLADNKSSLIY